MSDSKYRSQTPLNNAFNDNSQWNLVICVSTRVTGTGTDKYDGLGTIIWRPYILFIIILSSPVISLLSCSFLTLTIFAASFISFSVRPSLHSRFLSLSSVIYLLFPLSNIFFPLSHLLLPSIFYLMLVLTSSPLSLPDLPCTLLFFIIIY